MKYILTTILALTLSLVGCTTTSTGQKVVDPAVLELIAQSASSTGAIFWLADHPEDRDKFELARKSLKTLIATGNGNAADLQAALAALPIKQLQGDKGVIIVSSAVTVLTLAGKELAKLDKGQVYSLYVLPVAQGLLDGLDQALGPEVKAPVFSPGVLATPTSTH